MKTTPLCLASLLLLLAPRLMAEQTPNALGYTFPDQWEPRQGTMMIFPARHQYGRVTTPFRREFVALAKAIARSEPVTVFCHRPDADAARDMLGDVDNLTLRVGHFPIDWARDNAPILLRGPDGQLAAAGFRFNGWGMKYPGWQNDILTRDHIARTMGWPIFESDLVLEGGAIEISNGVGIVTESCVLNPNRTDWPRPRVEAELKAMLGLHTVIWLDSGLMPDPVTNGHVDGLVKFIAPNTVLLHTTDLQSDINYTITQNAKRTLQAHGLTVIELPLADGIVHINFYIGSGGDTAYVPVCGDPEQDDPALHIIGQHFNNVVPIRANHIGEQGGGVHCLVMQIPN
ncbi:MAG: agmatine deiminase family protein [Planctomycetota bacterium]